MQRFNSACHRCSDPIHPAIDAAIPSNQPAINAVIYSISHAIEGHFSVPSKAFQRAIEGHFSLSSKAISACYRKSFQRVIEGISACFRRPFQLVIGGHFSVLLMVFQLAIDVHFSVLSKPISACYRAISACYRRPLQRAYDIDFAASYEAASCRIYLAASYEVSCNLCYREL